MSFFGKNILVGVTSGIATYKAAYLVRELKKKSANVRVVMTKSATHFVGPLTFETLTEHEVLLDLFPPLGGKSTAHIEWARWPELIVLCPATANTIGKIAAGIADNALTTTILAATVPVVICPAMNKEMYANPLYQQNQQKLVKFGYHFVDPASGELACGEEGIGRLADTDRILSTIESVLASRKGDLVGVKILVTAGPTEEPIDPVRYLSNRSSGKMGFALADAAARRGAEVTLISGPAFLETPAGVTRLNVRTAADMKTAVDEHFNGCDVLIMSAAVSDFRPATLHHQKIKKGGEKEIIELVSTQDILDEVGNRKQNRILVGFSVETENEIENSISKLEQKNLDLIVVNNPNEEGAGFQLDTNRVTTIDAAGSNERWPLMSKSQVAEKILDKIVTILAR